MMVRVHSSKDNKQSMMVGPMSLYKKLSSFPCLRRTNYILLANN